MRLNELRPPAGQTHKDKRVGRGMGSGGRRAGRGDKGQKSRSGYSRRLGFEGGQNPLIRRLQKRGFHNPFKKEYAIVNLDSFAAIDAAEITPELLLEKGVIHKLHAGLRVLGAGEYKGKATIHAHHFSASAEKKIEAGGGKVNWIGGKPEPKPEPKPKPVAAPAATAEAKAPEAKGEKKSKEPKPAKEGKPEAKAESKGEGKPKKEKKESKPE